MFIGVTDLAISILSGILLFILVEEPFRKVGKFFIEKCFDKK
jgi:peptidoglycan/LPS O-acetylase OafA/YrhL